MQLPPLCTGNQFKINDNDGDNTPIATSMAIGSKSAQAAAVTGEIMQGNAAASCVASWALPSPRQHDSGLGMRAAFMYNVLLYGV